MRPINSGGINTLGPGRATPPLPVVAGRAYTWWLRVLVQGVDMTARLTGGVDIDREEGSAGVAGLTLCLDDGPVVPTDWVGRSVSIDFCVREGGQTTVHRRFTGWLAEPRWDPVARLLTCECSDNLQQRIEALSVAEIDALTPGHWSPDAFEPVTGRSHWDYCMERMSTVPASLDCDVFGTPRVTSWFAGPPSTVYGQGTTLDQSVEVSLAPQARVTNRVELELAYRYSRLREYRQRAGWGAPAGSFCAWRTDSHELPTVDDFVSAMSSAGLTPVGGGFQLLPPTHPDPCGTGAAWINNEPDLVLSGSVVGARRWVQPVTETYQITLRTALGEGAGAVVSRGGQAFEVESPDAEDWESSLRPLQVSIGTLGSIVREPVQRVLPGDRDDEARRAAFVAAELHAARVEVLAAHRQTSVGWAVPTPMALDVDLTSTLALDDQGVQATGKCRRLVDAFDLNTGEAVTTLMVAVMRGPAAATNPLSIPPRIGTPSTPDPDPQPLPSAGLPTQLGGKFSSPPYDDDREGFAGNYSIPQDSTLEVFPRRIQIDSVEIPAADTDEQQFAGAYEYVIGIPQDQLEM